MNYKMFKNYLDVAANAMDAQKRNHDEKATKFFADQGRWALHRMEAIFKDDERNIWRWLNGKPCVFNNILTGHREREVIPADSYNLYHCMVLDRHNKDGEIVDDAVKAQVARNFKRLYDFITAED